MNRIKELRVKNSLSQKELAKMIGVSDVSIHMYEHGSRYPKIDKLAKLAEVFGVSPLYIMGETEEDKLIESLSEISNSAQKILRHVEKSYIDVFSKLNDDGQKELFKYADYLYSQEKYRVRKVDVLINGKKVTQSGSDASEQ